MSSDGEGEMRLTAEQAERYEDDGFLAIERLIDDDAVACPLRAGGATMHSYGTPHYTPPNRSTDRSRRAYIFNFISKDGLKGILADRQS